MPKYKIKVSARICRDIEDTIVITAPDEYYAEDWALDEFWDRHCKGAENVDWDNSVIEEVE